MKTLELQKKAVERISREKLRWESFVRLALGVADASVHRDQQPAMLGKDDLSTVSKMLAAAQTRLLGSVQFPNRKDEDAFRNKVWEIFTDLNHGIWKSCFHSKQDVIGVLKNQLEESQAKVAELVQELKQTSIKSCDRLGRRDSIMNELQRLKSDLDSANHAKQKLQDDLKLTREKLEATEALPRHISTDSDSHLHSKHSLLKRELLSGPSSTNSHKSPASIRFSSISPNASKNRSATSTMSPSNSTDSCEVTLLRDKLSKEKERSLSFYRALKRKEKDCLDHHNPYPLEAPSKPFGSTDIETDTKNEFRQQIVEDNQKLQKQVALANFEANKLATELETLKTANTGLQRDFERQSRQVKKLELIRTKHRQDLSFELPSRSDDISKSSLNRLKERVKKGSIGSAQLLLEGQEREVDHFRATIHMLKDDIKEKRAQLHRQEIAFKSILDAEKIACRLAIEQAANSLNEHFSEISQRINEYSHRLQSLEHKASPLKNPEEKGFLRGTSSITLSKSKQLNLRSSQQIGELTEKLMQAQGESLDLLTQLKHYQDTSHEYRCQLKSKSDELEAMRQANSQLKAKQLSISNSQEQLTRDLTELQRNLKSKLDAANNTIKRLEQEKQQADQKITLLNKHIELISDERGELDANYKILKAEKSCDRMEIEGLRNQLSPRSVNSLKVSYLEEKIEEVVHSLTGKEDCIRALGKELLELREINTNLDFQINELRQDAERTAGAHRAKVTAKEQELFVLKQSLDNLQAEMNPLQAELARLKTANSTIEANLGEQHMLRIEELCAQVNEFKQKVEHLTEMKCSLETHSAKMKAETQRLEAELATAIQGAFFKQKSDAEAQKQLKAKQDRIFALIGEHEILRSELENSKEETLKAVASESKIKAEFESLKKNANETLAKLRKFESDYNTLELQTNELRIENQALYDQKAALEIAVKEAWRKMKDHETKSARLEAEKVEIEAKMEELETQLHKQESHLEEEEKAKRDLDLKFGQLKSESKVSLEQVDLLQREQENLLKQFRVLERELAQTTSDRDKIQSALEHITEEQASYKQEVLRSYEAESARMLAEKSELEAKLKEQQAQLCKEALYIEEAEHTKLDLEFKIRQLEANSSLHLDQVSLMESKQHELLNQCDDLTRELEKLSAEKQTLLNTLEQKTGEITAQGLQIVNLSTLKTQQEEKLKDTSALLKVARQEQGDLQGELVRVNHELDQLKHKIAISEDKLIKAKMSTDNEIAQLIETKRSLSSQLSNLSEEYQLVRQEFTTNEQSFRKEQKDLQRKIATLEKEIQTNANAAQLARKGDVQKLNDDLNAFIGLMGQVCQLMNIQPPTANPSTHGTLIADIQSFLKQEEILDRLVSELKAGRIEEVEGAVANLIKKASKVEKENENLRSRQQQLSSDFTRIEKEKAEVADELKIKETKLQGKIDQLVREAGMANDQFELVSKQLEDSLLQIKTYSSKISLLEQEHANCLKQEANLQTELLKIRAESQKSQEEHQNQKISEAGEMQTQLVMTIASLRRAEARCEELEQQNAEFRELFCTSPTRFEESDDESGGKLDLQKQLASMKKSTTERESRLMFEIQQLKEAIGDFKSEIEDLTEKNERLEFQLEEANTRSSTDATQSPEFTIKSQKKKPTYGEEALEVRIYL